KNVGGLSEQRAREEYFAVVNQLDALRGRLRGVAGRMRVVYALRAPCPGDSSATKSDTPTRAKEICDVLASSKRVAFGHRSQKREAEASKRPNRDRRRLALIG